MICYLALRYIPLRSVTLCVCVEILRPGEVACHEIDAHHDYYHPSHVNVNVMWCYTRYGFTWSCSRASSWRATTTRTNRSISIQKLAPHLKTIHVFLAWISQCSALFVCLSICYETSLIYAANNNNRCVRQWPYGVCDLWEPQATGAVVSCMPAAWHATLRDGH